MAKDQLARGARSASYGNAGVGESPLMQKIAEAEASGVVETVVEEPVQPFVRPAVKRKKFTPLGYTILVRQNEAVNVDGVKTFTDQVSALNDKSKELVVIRDEEARKQDAPAEGLVLATGPGTDEFPMTVTKGDEVVFGKYSGAAYNHNGEWVLLMGVNEVLGILTTQDIDDEIEETVEAPAEFPRLEIGMEDRTTTED